MSIADAVAEQIVPSTCPHISKMSGYVGYATAEGTPHFSCSKCFGQAAVHLLQTYRPSEIVDGLYLDDADDATIRGVMTQLLALVKSRCLQSNKKALSSESSVIAVSRAVVNKSQAEAVQAIIRKRKESSTN